MTKNLKAISALVLLGFLLLLFFIFKKLSPNQNLSGTITKEKNVMEETKDLKIEDLVVGTGPEAKAGNLITVHYAGTLLNGTKFDNSYDRGEPFSFTLGAGEVIAGWDQGFNGMKIGGKRRLTIPSQLGYGERGAPPVIPPNSTLIFEVELLEVK